MDSTTKSDAKVWCRGQAAIIAVFFLMSAMLVFAGGLGTLALRQANIVRAAAQSTESYFLAEAGLEDAAYRIITGKNISDTETLVSGGTTAETNISETSEGFLVRAKGDTNSLVRIAEMKISPGNEINFHYGLQTGNGGFVIENNAVVEGNVFSNGEVLGFNNHEIHGTVVSAGPNGLADGVYATSSVFAHAIRNSFIEGDAYYNSIDGATTVLGTKHPESENVATTSLPISEETLDSWEAVAAAGGTLAEPCPYVVDDETVTLGPVKINCDLEINGTADVTISGVVWVSGDITIKNFATVRTAPPEEGKSYVIIADNPSDRLESGRIIIDNQAKFFGSGENSYILLVSRNESAAEGGGEHAIEISNQSDAGELLVYSSRGEILLQNNTDLREVAAYTVHLKNNAVVRYRTGLANTLFKVGPEGGYDILEWRETQ